MPYPLLLPRLSYMSAPSTKDLEKKTSDLKDDLHSMNSDLASLSKKLDKTSGKIEKMSEQVEKAKLDLGQLEAKRRGTVQVYERTY